MTDSAALYFKGLNIRELQEPSLTRLQFKAQCANIILGVEGKYKEVYLEEHPNATEDELAKIGAQGRMDAIRELGKRSSFFLATEILQQDWLDSDYAYMLCQEVDLNKWKVNLWVLAREHLKSLIITGLSTLREILEDPNRTFCILSFKPDTAISFLATIRTWIEGDGDGPTLLRYLYKDIFWENPRKGFEYDENGVKHEWTWNQSQITVKRSENRKEPTIGTAGIEGGSITGMHYHGLIFDDAETEDSVTTPDSIEKLTNKVTNLFNAGQTGDLKFVMIGTFYAREDVYCRLLKMHICKSAIVQDCWRSDGTPAYKHHCYKTEILPDGREKKHYVGYTKEMLDEKIGSMTPVVAATQMRCDPSMSNNNSFDLTWIKRWPAVNIRGLNVFTVVDPAGDPTKRADYTSILTFGVDSQKYIYVIDLIRDKLTLDQKYARLVEIKHRYNPISVFYERVSMQADIAYLERCMNETNMRFNIIEFKTTTNKVLKISNLIPTMKRGMILFPDHCWHINWQGEMEDMLDSLIVDEMMSFPNCQHDDGLDTLSMANELVNSNSIPVPSSPFQIEGVDSNMLSYEEDDYDPMQAALDGLYMRA